MVTYINYVSFKSMLLECSHIFNQLTDDRCQQQTSCDKDPLPTKTKRFYLVTLYRKSLPTSKLNPFRPDSSCLEQGRNIIVLGNSRSKVRQAACRDGQCVLPGLLSSLSGCHLQHADPARRLAAVMDCRHLQQFEVQPPEEGRKLSPCASLKQ